MKKMQIIILAIITIMIITILIVTSEKKDQYREDQVTNFEKLYLPKKLNECLKTHGYSLESPTAEHKKECEDYVKQIWYEQKILNGIEE